MKAKIIGLLVFLDCIAPLVVRIWGKVKSLFNCKCKGKDDE